MDYYCELSPIPLDHYLDFSFAPSLLLYAYIPTLVLTLLLGTYILFSKSKFTLPNKLFFTFTVIYGLYLANEILQWVAVPAPVVHFGWEMVPLFFSLLSITLFYFVYTLTEEKSPSTLAKALLLGLFSPVLFLLPTKLNTTQFDVVLCEASVGPLNYYVYFLVATISTAIAFITIRKAKVQKTSPPIYLMVGSISMLGVLIFADYISSSVGHFEINLIGPIGMVIFLAAISYMIVKFKTFNTKLIGAQALVIILWALVGSLLFVAQSTTTKVVAAATLLFTTFAGYLLIRSVQNEVKQREKIEVLASDLGKANERLKELDKLKSEFVSIASHQLRSPLTSIRGYASMLVEESFGKMPEKSLEPLKRIEDSARLMAMAVEDYLNVSRIEGGNMKYTLSEFNLRDEVEKVSDDVRPVAMEKGLVLLFRTDMKGQGVVKADIGKTVQIIHNLINNSMKYTPKGSITVLVHDDIQKKRIYVDIIDTGIGINKENLTKLFQKFSRADNANTVNVSGTGLGLFVALKMAEAMGGGITAQSDGDGKGSKFTLELPLAL